MKVLNNLAVGAHPEHKVTSEVEVRLLKPKIVVNIHPHPDDAEWGSGGTMAKLIREGTNVYYLVCTLGQKGTAESRVKPEKLGEIRKKEMLSAAKLLGVKKVFFLGYTDGELSPSLELRERLMYYIRKLNPSIVFAPEFFSPWEYHPDHRAVGLMAFEAASFAHLPLYHPEHLKEGVKPWFVKKVWFYLTNEPNCWVDITETMDLKLRAMMCHRSQLAVYGAAAKRFGHYSLDKRSDEEVGCEIIEAFLRKEGEREGSKSGAKFAEGFRVYKRWYST